MCIHIYIYIYIYIHIYIQGPLEVCVCVCVCVCVLRKAPHVPISEENMSTFFYFEPFRVRLSFQLSTDSLLNTNTITSRYSDARGFLCTTPVDSLSILSLLQGPFDSPLVSQGTALQNDINVFIFQ